LQQEAVNALLRIDHDEWQAEAASREAFLKGFGDKLPPELLEENAALVSRLR
jgi:GTP-dependent phosphoenolpyruvate carboxykinase